MGRVYWIEDEIELLRRTRTKIERDCDHEVIVLQNVAEVLERLRELVARPGLVILDLFLPPGEHPEIPDDCEGPELGMWLLGRLQKVIGDAHPILILSGNISVDIADRLVSNNAIPEKRIYPKPLIESDEFVRAVDALARSGEGGEGAETSRGKR